MYQILKDFLCTGTGGWARTDFGGLLVAWSKRLVASGVSSQLGARAASDDHKKATAKIKAEKCAAQKASVRLRFEHPPDVFELTKYTRCIYGVRPPLTPFTPVFPYVYT